MAKLDKHFFDIGYMDTLSSQETPIHRLDPRAKLMTTLVFITTVVSFGKYEISGLIPYFVYPVVLCAVGNIPPVYLLKKILLVSPFAVMIGIFNPLMDRNILVNLGGIGISGGWVSFASILIRFVLTVGAALTLIAVTGFNAVCMALDRLGTPRVFVVQLMFLYRYMFVLVDEAARMVRARSLRTFEGGGSGIKAYWSFGGPLAVAHHGPAQRIHLAMCCRGFDGEIRILRPLKIRPHGNRIYLRLVGPVLFSCGFTMFPLRWGATVMELFQMSHHIVEAKDLHYTYPDGTSGNPGRLLSDHPRRVRCHCRVERRREIHAAASFERVSHSDPGDPANRRLPADQKKFKGGQAVSGHGLSGPGRPVVYAHGFR